MKEYFDNLPEKVLTTLICRRKESLPDTLPDTEWEDLDLLRSMQDKGLSRRCDDNPGRKYKDYKAIKGQDTSFLRDGAMQDNSGGSLFSFHMRVYQTYTKTQGSLKAHLISSLKYIISMLDRIILSVADEIRWNEIISDR